MEKIVKNALETQKLAQVIAAQLVAGDLILLSGDLGVGKTTFTQGLARGLGIDRPIKSPTYTLIREYQTGRLPLYHMDLYRLEETGGSDLGLEEYFEADGVCVLEWSQFIQSELPATYLKITLEKLSDDNMRKIKLTANNEHYQAIIEGLDNV